MDEALLRANARQLRTFQGEFNAACRAHTERIIKEMGELGDANREALEKVERGEQVDWAKRVDYRPTADEQSNIDRAALSVLANLASSFIALTEQLVGDIDQDMTSWKPPPE